MDKSLAKAVIHKLGSSGTPPEYGIDLFSVGLDSILKILEEEYFDGILKMNLSSFKLVLGSYGGGKTHFLYAVRNLAWSHGYVVSYVGLNPSECPFDKMEFVYKTIISCISLSPQNAELGGWDRGIESLLIRWLTDLKEKIGNNVEGIKEAVASIKGCESSTFNNAIKGALLSLLEEDEEGFALAVQWLKGEDIPREERLRFRISERIDKSTALRMLRSLAQSVNAMGYSGLILLFDEAERGLSLYSARDRRRALDNLRQIVDECGNARLPGTMIFYAVPDENLLLEGSGGVYEALKQRLKSSFTEFNPVGVKIDLENLDISPKDFLITLGRKLASLFESAYDYKFNERKLSEVLDYLSETALEFQLDISYRRLFVISAIETFQRMRGSQEVALNRQEARDIVRDSIRRISEQIREEAEGDEL